MFYENVRWPSWQAEVERVGGDQALWTAEGKEVAEASRRPIAAAEVWRVNMDFRSQLGRRRVLGQGYWQIVAVRANAAAPAPAPKK